VGLLPRWRGEGPPWVLGAPAGAAPSPSLRGGGSARARPASWGRCSGGAPCRPPPAFTRAPPPALCPRSTPPPLPPSSQTPPPPSGDDGGATIDEGSCMFGSLDGSSGTGHDIAALSDADPEFSGSCGRCYEGAHAGACLPATPPDAACGRRCARARAWPPPPAPSLTPPPRSPSPSPKTPSLLRRRRRDRRLWRQAVAPWRLQGRQRDRHDHRLVWVAAPGWLAAERPRGACGCGAAAAAGRPQSPAEGHPCSSHRAAAMLLRPHAGPCCAALAPP
jgi:hypothetical protein